MPEVNLCQNCENKLETEYKFCPNCGQQSQEKLTLGVLFYNTICNYFSFDARFFKSIVPLIFKPGFLAKNFIQGKRLHYLHPAQMYLFVTVVFFFMLSFNQREQTRTVDEKMAQTFKSEKKNIGLVASDSTIESTSLANHSYNVDEKKDQNEKDSEKLHFELDSPESAVSVVDSILKKMDESDTLNLRVGGVNIDSLIAIDADKELILKSLGMPEDAGALSRRFYSQCLRFYKYRQGGSVLNAFYNALPVSFFFLLPIFALFLKLFYRKSGPYVHHLVFSFYFFAFLFILFGFLLLLRFFIDLPDAIESLFVLSAFIYFVIALKKYYSQTFLKSFVKAVLIGILFLILVIPITLLVLSAFAFMFY